MRGLAADGLRTLGPGPLLALALGLVWARFLADVSGDLAAQAAWTDFVARHPGSADDLAWYGGAYPAAYSLAAPQLMALLGVRVAGVASVVAGAAFLALLVRRSGVHRPWTVSTWGAFALWCDLAAGRVSFAVGLAVALGAVVLALGGPPVGRGRVVGCVFASALATAASPLAGLFLEVVAAALLLTGRRAGGWALAVPPVLVVAGAALLFPSYGVDPNSGWTVLVTVACAALLVLLAPAGWRTARVAAAVYALGAVATWVVDTPIGGNVGRLAMVLASVPFLAALCAPGPRRTLRSVALALAFAATAYWVVAADLVGLPPRAPVPAGAAALGDELRRLHADRARVEAVPMLNHWESWGLADAVQLARGWNRQLDAQRDPLFYEGTLTPDRYHAWLRRWAVRYVVLSATPPDVAALDEVALIRSAPPFLRPVWQSDSWQVYEVTDPTPLADPPARTQRADAAQVLLTVPIAGTIRLRVPWSRWLAAHGPGSACLRRDGDWTALRVGAPGTYRLTAPYAWPPGTPCRA
ncbi:MFS transporter [Streptacidiphilus pinicola]|uniref:MFS transporter n=1 Tax=Streptacidiphilus pinicola TaxID=2219663 RepID=A0A2X0IEQ6_9ACTN|nr:MFS transporter [Streptacidiphilus pinicola]RAG81921.1 MFS transporter [Streptacidiphilus pinicola]